MQLYIGNKNYSSWSLRPWLLMTHMGIAFEEVRLRMDFNAGSPFRQTLAGITPAARVPVLVDEGLAVWDSLAISEYLAEKFADKDLWPRDFRHRARARSLCAEMHSGFAALRTHCPMNIEASLPDAGAKVLAQQPAVASDLDRIAAMWQTQLSEHGGPFLFGEFSIADAFYAPVCARIATYGLPVAQHAAAYVQRMLVLPAMQAWTNDARSEHDFLAVNEPYRQASAQP